MEASQSATPARKGNSQVGSGPRVVEEDVVTVGESDDGGSDESDPGAVRLAPRAVEEGIAGQSLSLASSVPAEPSDGHADPHDDLGCSRNVDLK